MIPAVTSFGHSPQPVKFAGNDGDDEKAAALRKAQQATEEARGRLEEAQAKWGNVTPAQKAGIKSVVGLILLAVANGNKKNSVVRTLALLGAAGLLGSAGTDLYKLQKRNRLLPKSIDFESAPKMGSPAAIQALKQAKAEESAKLQSELDTGKLDLKTKIEMRMRLLEIEAVQAELDEQLARLQLNA